MAAVAEQLGQLGSASRAATGEAERIAAGIASATAARDADQTTLEELTARLEAAQATPDEGEPSHEERDRLAEAAVLARQAEVEARLAVRTGEERVRALAGRAEQLEHAANAERAARASDSCRRESAESTRCCAAATASRAPTSSNFARS